MPSAFGALALLALSGGPRDEPTVVAGAAVGQDAPAVLAKLSGPEGLAVDSGGRLYIADRWNNRIRVVDESRTRIETLVGTGGYEPFKDGARALEAGISAQLLAVDAGWNVYFAGNEDPTIWRYDAGTRTISRFAGTFAGPRRAAEFGGDGGPALSAAMKVHGIACDRDGNLYVAGQNRIRRISARTRLIETIAGTGRHGFFGDGGPAVAADLGGPTAIAVDAQGTVYFSDAGNNRIRAIDRKGRIRTAAGNGRSGPFTEGDPLRSAVGEVLALAIDPGGNVVFLDWAKNVRRLRVGEQLVETLLYRPNHDLNRTREAPGLAVSPTGTIFFDVPQRNCVESIAPLPAGRPSP